MIVIVGELNDIDNLSVFVDALSGVVISVNPGKWSENSSEFTNRSLLFYVVNFDFCYLNFDHYYYSPDLHRLITVLYEWYVYS